MGRRVKRRLKSPSFFSLQPPDLLQKLELDYERMKGNPLDAYAAFDFFVTATSITDWLRRRSGREKQWRPPEWDPRDEQICGVCAALANNAKHFVYKDALKGTEARAAAERSAFALWPGGHLHVPPALVIHLAPTEADLIGSNEITALAFAELVLDLLKRSRPAR